MKGKGGETGGEKVRDARKRGIRRENGEIERRGKRMGSQNEGESRRERGERRTRQRGKRS